jgi:hypothetical protein
MKDPKKPDYYPDERYLKAVYASLEAAFKHNPEEEFYEIVPNQVWFNKVDEPDDPDSYLQYLILYAAEFFD